MSAEIKLSEVKTADRNDAVNAGGDIFKRAFYASGGNIDDLYERLRTETLTQFETVSEGYQRMTEAAGETGAMRMLSPMPLDLHKIFDEVVIRVARDRLVMVDFMIERGMVQPVTDFLAHTVYNWKKQSDVGTAFQGMWPGVRGENFRNDIVEQETPLYLTWFTLEFNARELLVMNKRGNNVDTTHIEGGVRKINELIEQSTLTGTGFNVAGLPTYGLLNEPNVNTYSYVGGVTWDDPAKTGPDILKDVQNMGEVLRLDNKYGPKILGIPSNYLPKMGDDYTTGYPKTIQERLLELPWLEGIREVPRLPDDTTLMLEATSETADLLNGGSTTVVPYDTEGGMISKFIVFAAVVPRVKSDYIGQSGAVVGTP